MNTMTTAETTRIQPLDPSTWKGCTGQIESKGMTFKVDILDGRYRFGHFDVLVRPRSGDGQTWIEHHKVHILDAVR